MNKKTFATLLCLILSIGLSAQQPQKSNVKSSKAPWRFGIKAGASYDGLSIKSGGDYKFGFRAGVSAEKHLVYNLFFQPSLNFAKKGFKYEIANGYSLDVDAMVVEIEAALAMKFGDERTERGFFINLIPYYTYGVGGKTKHVDLNPISETFNREREYKTFENNNTYDLGFKLGVGYDFSSHLSLTANYTFGMNKFSPTANYRWRSWGVQLILFF